MKTQAHQMLLWVAVAALSGPPGANAQFTASTKLGSGLAGTIVTNAAGSYSVMAGGQDIFGAGDQFTFHNFSFQGTFFDLRARVQSLEPNARLTRAGLMVRETTATNSRMAFVRVTPTGPALNGETGANDVRFQYRVGTTTPAQGQHEDPAVGFPAPNYPNAWVRLERHGNIIGSYSSTDGTNWLLLADQDTALWPGGAFLPVFNLGLAQSRHPAGTKPTNSVEYRNYSSTGNFPPILSDIGNVIINEDTGTGAIAFQIGDVETAAANLTVTASSSNPTLFPAGSVVPGGTGTNRNLTYTPANNQNGIATITVTVSDGVRTASDRFQVTVSPVNDPPTISALQNLSIPEDGTTGQLPFVVGDPDSAQSTLVLSGFADNPTLVPTNNITFLGNTANRTVTVSPAPNQFGTTRITLRVSDGSLSNATVFTLTVLPVNDPPTITTIADQTIFANNSVGPLPFTIGDVETPAASLILSRASSNTNLVPLANIALTGAGTARNVTVTPVANGFGTANITVNVSDGTNTVPSVFKLTVNPVPVTIVNPPQDQTVEEGGRASFSVSANGTPPLRYQWSFNGQQISGATDNSFTISSVKLSDAGPYTVAIANPAGTLTATAVLAVVRLDYGDAPKPFPTLLAEDGARHRIVPDMFLGSFIDGETNGQPTAAATGDDLNPTTADDEDGVAFLTALVPGQAAAVQVTASKPGRLDAWIDFDANGSWADSGNHIFASRALAAGANTLAFTVPATAKVGGAFARFRYSTKGDLNFIGPADDGEVEDYFVNIVDRALDLGDAPASYRTLLADGGPSHILQAGFFLGGSVDAEPDGQPSPNALGDDNPGPAGIDDEDGVTFLSAVVAGAPAIISVVASSEGRLDAWFDFNGNGSFADPGEQIFTSQALNPGANTLQFNVPSTAAPRDTFARFRFSRQGGLRFDGPAPDGEVEDYQVSIEARSLDFGDAPQNYPVLLSQNGARHASSQLHLGAIIDLESDGQPSADALGDDNTIGAIDDEDGVKFLTPLVPGQTAQVEVTVNISCFLDAWIDWNINGSWAETNEHIFVSQPISSGATVLSFTVPANALSRATYARFRVSSKGALNFTGFAPDGEVEDYRIDVEQRELDFGDAPQNYPVLLANNGARHIIVPGFHLGERIDGEPNGQPSADALGDDNTAGAPDDEDGVRFLTPLIPGQTAQVEVTASAEGLLNAWVDFNINGSWGDDNEHIFIDVPLATGPNTLAFVVPASSTVPRATYARFRFSHQEKLSFDGAAADGEVEDYRVEQGRPRECDQDCTGTNFWLTFPGNYAPDTNNPVRLTVCLIGSAGTSGNISIPGLGLNFVFVLPASGTLIFPLPKEADLGDSNDVITRKGIHIVAGGPISIQALNRVKYTSDGYLAFPAHTLGTEYLVDSFGNTHNGAPDLNGSQFAVAASENNTRVRITPRIAVGGHPANVPFDILMQAGETYQLRATNDAPADLTGTSVESDRPIAVFGSHQCANIPTGNQWFCDYIVEQLMPIKAWGRGFLTAPLETRNGDTFRILASADDTDVFIGGSVVANLNRGEFHQVAMSTGAVIIASAPVSVMQYANSSDYDAVTDSDPFMVIVPPATQFNANHVVCTGPTDFNAHYINIIAPAAAVGALTLDGAVVPAAAFTQIGSSAFRYAQLPVAFGRHSVVSPQPVGVTVYGWGEYDSYGYTGCIAFGDTTPPTIVCRVTNVTVTLGTGGSTVPNCVALVPDLRSTVQVSDNCGLSPNSVPRQVPAPGTPVGAGVHPITITVFDAQGNAASCVITFTVIDPGAPTLNCPSNVVARCTNPSGGIARYVVTARTICSTNIPVQCNPPSGSFIPPGVTTVTCVANNGGQTATCAFPVNMVCEKLTLSTVNGVTVLTWQNGTLESTTSLTGVWTAVPNARSPYAVPTNRTAFYRLRFDEP